MNKEELLARLAEIQNFLENTPIITGTNFNEINADIDHVITRLKDSIYEIREED